jgi:RNase P/RNase MRP subunit p29
MRYNTSLTETNKLIKFDTEIAILESSNPFNKNRTGKIVNISRNMIFLKESKTKKIIKIAKNEISFFQVTDQFHNMILPGKRLLGRPEEVVV